MPALAEQEPRQLSMVQAVRGGDKGDDMRGISGVTSFANTVSYLLSRQLFSHNGAILFSTAEWVDVRIGLPYKLCFCASLLLWLSKAENFSWICKHLAGESAT